VTLLIIMGCETQRASAPRRAFRYTSVESGSEATARSATSLATPIVLRADALRVSVWQTHSLEVHQRYEGVVCWRVYFECRPSDGNDHQIFWADPAEGDAQCETARTRLPNVERLEHPWRRSGGETWSVPIPQTCRERGFIEAYVDVLPGLDCRPVNAQLAYHSVLGRDEIEHRVVLDCAPMHGPRPSR
jgi:hypothetical protein